MLHLPAPPAIVAATGWDAEPVDPPFRWVGGKRGLIRNYRARLPDLRNARGYREPFLGGGAFFFALAGACRPAILGDCNRRLIDTYRAIRDEPDALLWELAPGRHPYTREHFEKIRRLLNTRPDAPLVLRASWFLIVIAWGFNGLYREAQNGACNTPFGKPSQPGTIPPLCSPAAIRACSAVLQGADLSVRPFDELLADVAEGEVIYLDPPYAPISLTASFTTYAAGGFSYVPEVPAEQDMLFQGDALPRKKTDWQRLCACLADMSRRGAHWILSQSATDQIVADLDGYYVLEIAMRRSLSCDTETRDDVTELLVSNRPFREAA